MRVTHLGGRGRTLEETPLMPTTSMAMHIYNEGGGRGWSDTGEEFVQSLNFAESIDR